MEINYPAWSFWRDIVVILCAGGSAVYTWWSNRGKVTAKRFTTLETEMRKRVTEAALQALDEKRELRCDSHRTRTSSIEKELQGIYGEIKHLPNQGDIGRVHARMDEVHGLAKEMKGELQATRHQLNLVLEQLMRRD